MPHFLSHEEFRNSVYVGLMTRDVAFDLYSGIESSRTNTVTVTSWYGMTILLVFVNSISFNGILGRYTTSGISPTATNVVKS